jgi:hypothetical protein
MSNFTNFHIIKVTYLGATNSKGSRVKMTSERFEESKTINYNHEFNNTLDIAEDYLTKAGFEVVGHAEGKGCYYVITNTFKGLKKA